MDERERMLAELERDFASRVVHQVKTPLALMHGYAMTLLERDLPDEQRRWFLEVIARQTHELSDALDRLDELRRLHDAPQGGTTALGEALQVAVERVGEERPDLIVSLPPGGGSRTRVAGPARWVTRALVECLVAAAEAGGPVSVRLRGGRAVTVTIEGDGTIREHGLGLYLAQRVAERFGGGLTVRDGRITLRFTAG